MAASHSKRTGRDAIFRRAEDPRCGQQSRGMVDARAIRPRALVIVAREQVDYPLRRALEAEYDVSRDSSPDRPFDGLLPDADIAVVDWSMLNRTALKTARGGCRHDTSGQSPFGIDLYAVRQLGTILKGLSAASRARPRLIN